MNLYKKFKTDSDKSENGVWVEFPVDESNKNPAFLISYMAFSNKKYKKCFESRSRPFLRQIEMKTLSNNKAQEIEMDVFIDSILLDWRNIHDENGKIMQFSRENITKLFTDLPELYEKVKEIAQDRELFLQTDFESSAKN